MLAGIRPLGMESTTSVVMTRCCVALWTSTSGLSAVTVTVSSSEPTRRSALMAAVNVP